MLASLALLTACATAPRPAPMDGARLLTGRLLVKVDASGDTAAQTVSASFELQGDERQGWLRLISPLGTQVADARWTPASATLVAADGQSRSFTDLDALAQSTFGQSLPLGALTHWLAGLPWTGASHTPTTTGFEQLGWSIDLSRWDSDAMVEARRLTEAGVLVRARLDR